MFSGFSPFDVGMLSGFMVGQGGMRLTWQEGSGVMGSGLGSGTGLLFHIRRQERGPCHSLSTDHSTEP